MKKSLPILLVLISITIHCQIKTVNLVSKMNGVFLDESGNNIPYWGFGEFEIGGPLKPSLPGPFLEFNQNDSVIIHFLNGSPENHTIHLHGLDVDQIYDGVGHTSFEILPNDTFNYIFKTPNPGVFLYHCHVLTTFHLALGMYGMISVNASDSLFLFNGGPGYNKKYHFLSTDMYQYWNLNMTSPGPFYLYDPDYFMINGKSGNQLFENTSNIIEAEAGDSVLLRLGNLAYSMVEYIFPYGSNPKVYMSDGRPLPTPFTTDTLRIHSGERFSVVLKPTQHIEDYITINYLNMYGYTFEGKNHIGINQMEAPVNILETSESSILIYPNPIKNDLTIELDHDYDFKDIQLFDLMGRSYITTHKLENRKITMDCSQLDQGVYIIQIRQSNGSFISKKIIVQP